MKKGLTVFILSAIFIFSSGLICVYGANNVIFEMSDKEGDDNGPGGYTYPSNVAFEPGSGRFDLLNFKVSADDENVYFDFEFKTLVNTYSAYEGFSDQLIDLYIDNAQGGEISTLHKGANVQFSNDSKWDVYLRAAPYKQSFFHTLHKVEQPVKNDALIVERVANTNIIRAIVDKNLIGVPDTSWKYYVLVGSFDSYGDDCYRPIAKERSEWIFGGGTGSDFESRVIDLLDYASGDKSQHSMLKTYSNDDHRLAVIYPVGLSSGRKFNYGFLVLIFGVCGLCYVVYGYVRKVKKAKQTC